MADREREVEVRHQGTQNHGDEDTKVDEVQPRVHLFLEHGVQSKMVFSLIRIDFPNAGGARVANCAELRWHNSRRFGLH